MDSCSCLFLRPLRGTHRSTKDWIEPQLVIGAPFNFLELCVTDTIGGMKRLFAIVLLCVLVPCAYGETIPYGAGGEFVGEVSNGMPHGWGTYAPILKTTKN